MTSLFENLSADWTEDKTSFDSDFRKEVRSGLCLNLRKCILHPTG